MPNTSLMDAPLAQREDTEGTDGSSLARGMKVALLTGCKDRHYAFGMAMGLAAKGIHVDVIGSDEIDSPELHTEPNIRFLNLRGNRGSKVGAAGKLTNLLSYYAKLIWYAARSDASVFHILWNNKLELFDRTVLMLYYRLCGKRIVFTAHNVNQARRDEKDSFSNRATLKMQYGLSDHVFVHTQKMKEELCREFGKSERAITVLRYPMNNAVPETDLTPQEAKHRLGLKSSDRAVMCFGRIRPYKGIEHLIEAFQRLKDDPHSNYRLIIAGEPKKGSEEYLREIEQAVKGFKPDQVILEFKLIPDEEIELYFKAADVLVLPYKEIFQSGVLFLAYSLGLPAVATDVGSFREDIVEGSTGYLCRPGDPEDMARAIRRYFSSDLYRNLADRRRELVDYAHANHSWSAAAELTCRAYAQITGRKPS